jgi:hypothetical protein
MRKNKPSFPVIFGVAIGVATGIASQNISASVFIGAGSGLLFFLLTILKVERNNRT